MAATVSRDQFGGRRLIIAAAAAVSLLAPALVAAVVGARSVESGVIADVPAMPGTRLVSAMRLAARTIILEGTQP